MAAYFCITYLSIGLVVTGFVFAIFKPSPGYRPTIKVLLMAGLTHVILWPITGLLGVGYLAGRYFSREQGEESTHLDTTYRFRQRILFDKTYLRN